MSLDPCSAEATYLYHCTSHREVKAHVRNRHYIRTSGQDLTTDKNPAFQYLKKKKAEKYPVIW